MSHEETMPMKMSHEDLPMPSFEDGTYKFHWLMGGAGHRQQGSLCTTAVMEIFQGVMETMARHGDARWVIEAITSHGDRTGRYTSTYIILYIYIYIYIST